MLIEDIAKYFGVSVYTVNNWIRMGRFVGISDASQITEDTVFTYYSDDLISMKKAIVEYEREVATLIGITEEERLKAIKDNLDFFEHKYHGMYEEVRVRSGLSDIDDSCLDQWAYLIGEYNKITERQNNGT